MTLYKSHKVLCDTAGRWVGEKMKEESIREGKEAVEEMWDSGQGRSDYKRITFRSQKQQSRAFAELPFAFNAV